MSPRRSVISTTAGWKRRAQDRFDRLAGLIFRAIEQLIRPLVVSLHRRVFASHIDGKARRHQSPLLSRALASSR